VPRTVGREEEGLEKGILGTQLEKKKMIGKFLLREKVTGHIPKKKKKKPAARQNKILCLAEM